MTDPKPCRRCDSPVRIEVGYGLSRGGVRGTRHEKRVCTNPDCTTNNPLRKKRLADGP